jgi:PAS domain S-box-containing protein
MTLLKKPASFKGKLTVLVITAILLPLIISGVLFQNLLGKQLETILENRLISELKSFSLVLKNHTEELNRGLSKLASDNTIQMTLNLEIFSQLEKYLEAQMKVLNFSTIEIYDNDAELITTLGLEITDRHISNQTVLITSGNHALLCSASDIKRDDQLLGHIHGAVSLTDEEFLEDVNEILVDSFVVWTDDGIIASDLDWQLLSPENLTGNNSEIENIILGKEPYRIMTASIYIGGKKLSYGILVPLYEIRNGIIKISGLVISITMLIFVIILVLLQRFIRTMIRPITDLTLAAEAIEGGDTNIPNLETERADEFGRLNHTFLKMYSSLNQSIEDIKNKNVQLKKVNEEIERRVEERTLELKAEIAERIQAQDANQRLVTAIEDAAEAIIVTSPEFHVQYVNPAFERITGYTREEINDRDLSDFMPEVNGNAFHNEIYQTVTGNKPWRGKFSSMSKDGTIYEVEATFSPIYDKDHNITNYVSVQRDITTEAKLESQLRQAQKMEAIGTLAGGIAHDFNNILFAIIGFNDLAMEEIQKGSSAYQYLKEVSTASVRAANLVSQILAFSRYSENEKRQLSMAPILKEAIKMLRGTLPSTIEIRQEIDEGCSPIVAESTQIHQVIMNLCTNAYHAMRESGGLLGIKLMDTIVDDELASDHEDLAAGKHLLLSVSDSGKGMDETTRDRIFEPYFTTKEVGRGTGLGLATVHGIVRNHGGTITVQTEVNKGTTFSIYFPVKDEGAGSAESQISGNIVLNGTEKIMYVDDEASISKMVEKTLQRRGYTIQAFSDSRDALQCFKGDPDYFDMIITDQTMPNLTGSELATIILGTRPNMPIILCTGYSELINEQEAKKIGIRTYLKKPVDSSTLTLAIRKLLD